MHQLLFFFFLKGFLTTPLFSNELDNGITFDKYQNFSKEYALLAIRFRKDTEEMRLIYANDLALKTMQAGSTQYPDGAIFAKAAFRTSPDPQFASSLAPREVRRYQLMIRDQKKYAYTGGWGYALFDSLGKKFPEDPKKTEAACYACHLIVENRGDVFSEPFHFLQASTASGKKFVEKKTSPFKYVWLQKKELPIQISKHLPKKTKRIRSLQNQELRKNIFQGTLDEVKPMLEEEARKKKAPALFMSIDKKKFTLILWEKSDECTNLDSYKIISTDVDLSAKIERHCLHD